VAGTLMTSAPGRHFAFFFYYFGEVRPGAVT
jgi:hypothetical protein